MADTKTISVVKSQVEKTISVVFGKESINYFLLSDVLSDEENNLHTVYGVMIRHKSLDGETTQEAHDLCCDKSSIMDFIEKLAENMASPDILPELAEDFVVRMSL